MELISRIVFGVVGAAMVLVVIDASIRAFVLPRGASVMLVRIIARASRSVFTVFTNRTKTYEQVDRIMALYAPITLLLFPAAFLIGVFVGFAGLFYATTGADFGTVVRYSGSALFTLGFSTPGDMPATALVFVEAGIGLTLLALLISYLPSIYGAFSRREVAVSRLSVRAGSPPSAVELLERAQRAQFNHRLNDLFEEWELWFVEIEETHTSQGILSFFRSPNPDRSWLTAAGTILDTASLRMSVVDQGWSPSAGLCVRSGFLALRSVADLFGLDYEPDPQPDAPISISRSEFDEACARLEATGVQLLADKDQAWNDFRGWRVNYDAVLLGLCSFVMAPPAPWSSDRSPAGRHRPPLRNHRSDR